MKRYITQDETQYVDENGEIHNIEIGSEIKIFEPIDDDSKPVIIKGSFVKSLDDLDYKFLEYCKKGKKYSMYYLVNIMKIYCEANTNILKKNNEKLKINDIAKISGLSRQKISEIISELLDINVIGKIDVDKKEYLVLNPYLYLRGKSTLNCIYKKFKCGLKIKESEKK